VGGGGVKGGNVRTKAEIKPWPKLAARTRVKRSRFRDLRLRSQAGSKHESKRAGKLGQTDRKVRNGGGIDKWKGKEEAAA